VAERLENSGSARRIVLGAPAGCDHAEPGTAKDVSEIVVGYDGSAEAEHALARAADFAEALSARLVVISVSKSSEPAPTLAPAGPAVSAGTGMIVPVLPGDTVPPSEAEIERLSRPAELAYRQLEEARTALASRAVEAEFVAEEGEMAERLLAVAGHRDADLIVVGSREHGFLDRLLGRPVDEAVARRADRDVLLVH
jgi:nucleotide-binding universal stress UspA family protein